jgi:PAS domain S-box-containing protein
VQQYFSFTGIVYTPITLVFVILAYRFYREYRSNATAVSRDIFLYFLSLALICFSGALAGTIFLSNRSGTTIMLVGSSLVLSFANAVLGHLFFIFKYPHKPAWWGFVPIFLYGLLVTVLTLLGPIDSHLEQSGGLDWGLPDYIDYLRASVYLIGTIPVGLVYLKKYQLAADRYEKSEDLFLLMVFGFALLVVITDFIIEPLLATGALLSEEILLLFAVIGMILYFWLNEKTLSQSEERLDLAVRGAGIGLWDWSISEREVICNKRFAEIMGYTQKEVSPISLESLKQMIHQDDLDQARKLLQKHLTGGSDIFEMEIRVKHRGGHWIWVADRGKVITWDSNGKPVRMAGTHLDITERKIAETSILESLKEKENLLQEVYHRTKNNMNVIISLLNMQERELEQREIVGVLQQVSDRIFSMSQVHELLYNSDNFSTVKLDEYIKTLINHLRASVGIDSRGVEINCECSPIDLELNQAVPLGLVLNEILTNCFKHAFPSAAGRIDLMIQEIGKTGIQIKIRDNGIGFPAEVDPADSQTMGLKIIRMLIEDQLMGQLTIVTDVGVQYDIFLDADMTKSEYLTDDPD